MANEIGDFFSGARPGTRPRAMSPTTSSATGSRACACRCIKYYEAAPRRGTLRPRQDRGRPSLYAAEQGCTGPHRRPHRQSRQPRRPAPRRELPAPGSGPGADLRLDGLRHHHGVRRPLRQSHPARQDPHAECLVPGAAAAPGIRRLRRQHRLQPQAPRGRRLPHGHGGPGFRRLPRVDDARRGVPADHVRVIDSELTAQAFITTDLDDNQITAFHPGAMQHRT